MTYLVPAFAFMREERRVGCVVVVRGGLGGLLAVFFALLVFVFAGELKSFLALSLFLRAARLEAGCAGVFALTFADFLPLTGVRPEFGCFFGVAKRAAPVFGSLSRGS